MRRWLLFAVLVLSLGVEVHGESHNEVNPNGKEPAEAAGARGAASEGTFLSRHLMFVNMESDFRYRYLDRGASRVSDRDFQHKISTQLQINLRSNGATYLSMRGETGRSFSSSWDYNGKGLNRGYWSYNLKSFYLGHKIGAGLEAQVGGIEFDRGAGSEATYADNDGWMEGYRLRYSNKKLRLAPDKYSITIGYVGDFARPNFFERASRMGEINYLQALASKDFGNKSVSAEFDTVGGVRYTREAIRAKKLSFVVVDELQVESIARLSGHARFGWSANLAKDIGEAKRIRLGVFYSDIPSRMFVNAKTTVLLNGDSYALGRRIGPVGRYTPAKNLEVSFFASTRLDSVPGCRYRAQLAVKYQFADALNRVLKSL